jgi:hypothetical protein
MEIIRSIQNRIYEIRGERVMLDRDLAALYETETKALNLAVKRNLKRFPHDFMFQLTKEEFDGLRFQIETLDNDPPLRLQNETLKSGRGQHSKYLPYAFTEQGIAYDAMENLLDEKASQRKWDERERIGFKRTS